MRPWPDVLVIGAGVSGLTTAICLAEAGFPVRILTKESPHATTSCAAGAIWSPYLVTEARVVRWSTQSLAELESLAAVPGTGVRRVSGREASRVPIPPPDWAVGMADFRPCADAELP
ncbi:MAG: FAD-binding oxidoreductase, partial [Micromonosporaceae bacterium]|nr:FAD-binding oxidoreductase [Micromonosporaceae bacterium]